MQDNAVHRINHIYSPLDSTSQALFNDWTTVARVTWVWPCSHYYEKLSLAFADKIDNSVITNLLFLQSCSHLRHAKSFVQPQAWSTSKGTLIGHVREIRWADEGWRIAVEEQRILSPDKQNFASREQGIWKQFFWWAKSIIFSDTYRKFCDLMLRS